MGGRVAFGILGDRLGAKRVLVAGLLLRRLARLPMPSCATSARSTPWRRCSASSTPASCRSTAVIARENFPLRMMGTVIGGMSMAGSLGMATGPLAGGLIFDAFGSYSWLFIGSFGLGIGAFLIAMTFRPFPETPVAGDAGLSGAAGAFAQQKGGRICRLSHAIKVRSGRFLLRPLRAS